MAELENGKRGLGRILPLVNLFTEGTLALFLGNVLEVWDLVSQIRDRVGYHSMYEILSYESTLEFHSPDAEEASITRHQVIRFLQNNIVGTSDSMVEIRVLDGDYNLTAPLILDDYTILTGSGQERCSLNYTPQSGPGI